MRRVEAAFESYRFSAMPANAHPLQVQECKRAFYAGAWALFTEIVTNVSPGPDVTPADDRLMDEIRNELETYARGIGGH